MRTCTLQPSAVDFSHTLGGNAVGFFFPFNCQILQDEGSIIPHLWLRVLDEDAAQPNICWLSAFLTRLAPAWSTCFYIHVCNLVLYTYCILLQSILVLSVWRVSCENERFLKKAKATKEAVAEQGVSLWRIPPRSPDLNPVEKCWGWLWRELRRLDLQDRSKKKRPLSKSAYAVRVRSLCGSQKAQRVASHFAKGLKRVRNEVIAKEGAASSG
jgi:hypothetical protein